MLPPELTNTAK